MATTTNYSWVTPDDTSLVKDGASAIRTLGSSVDTTVKALNPGTTSGDLDYYTSSTTKVRLAKGTAGQVLQMNSGATAPEWASAGGMTVLASGSLPAASALNLTSISQSYLNLVLVVRDFYTASDDYLKLRLNNSSGTYVYSNVKMTAASTAAFEATTSNAAWMINTAFDNTDKNNAAYIEILDYTNTTSNKLMTSSTSSRSGGDTYNQIEYGTLAWIDPSAVTQVNLLTNGSNFSGGTYILYGVK